MNAHPRTPLFSTKLVFGLVVLLVGLILLADRLRLYDAWHLLTWWPLALTAFGLARLAQDGPLSLRGHVWLAFSAAGFISQFGPWGFLERWWPAFLVWGGVVVTLRALLPEAARKPAPSPEPPVSCDPEVESRQVNP